MNEIVVVFRLNPLLLKIVDEKVYVLWHVVRLDGREVDAGKDCVGIPIAHYSMVIPVSWLLKVDKFRLFWTPLLYDVRNVLARIQEDKTRLGW